MKIVILNKKKPNQAINKTIKILKKGGLIIFPSDTVYGALVDATNEQAVKKLITFKARPPGKPISVFVSGFKMLKEITNLNRDQEKILREILPGPFTVVLSSKQKTSRLLESEKGTLGVRYPLEENIIKLAAEYGRPITATSANQSGYSPHYSVKSLLGRLPKQKQSLIDLIVDGGQLPRNKPSTVIDLTTPAIKILRQGEIVFKDSRTFFSQTPFQTKKIAQFLIKKLLKKKITKPVVIIIEGELGVGKTVFVKGIGEWLGINNIVSPSFVIYYEYQPAVQSVKRLIHMDLYNIEESSEFRYLGIKKYLKPGNILCIEWGEKTGEILPMLKQYAADIIYIKMKYLDENKRGISLHYIDKL